MKKILLLLLVLVSVGIASAQKMNHSVSPVRKMISKVSIIKHRIIFQMTTNDTLAWKGLMNNLKYLKEGWGDTVQIEVVAHGNGIEMLMKSKTTQQQKIAEFKRKGIVFVGCENTMKDRKIAKEDIIPEAGFVPMGIGELVMKQEQGWCYIKSGF